MPLGEFPLQNRPQLLSGGQKFRAAPLPVGSKTIKLLLSKTTSKNAHSFNAAQLQPASLFWASSVIKHGEINWGEMFGYERLIAIILGFACKKSYVKRIETPFGCSASIWHEPLGMSRSWLHIKGQWKLIKRSHFLSPIPIPCDSLVCVNYQ